MWLEFSSDRFDHTSELPPDANAGNRFYGGDVAEFISSGLAARGYATRVVDEDWGWLVLARPLEISIYHDIDEVDPERWALNVQERSRFRRREPGEPARETLVSLFRDAGIQLGPADR
jgi:hypothetical protein